MVSRPSVVFLFDTELILDRKLKELVTSEINNVLCTDVIRQVTFSILNNFYDKQNGTQWGYRFYTSSSYRLTAKTRFFDLSMQTLDDFEEAVNLNFEQKPDFVVDIANQTLPKASVLSRALQDIVSDYDWKTPSDSLTPTRKGRKPGKSAVQESNQHQNLVFIFTEIPTDGRLQDFCHLKSQQDVTLKAVTDSIFSRELVKRFQEFKITLNFIDFSANEKNIFSQLVNSLNGAIINAKALVSPFSFQHVLQASSITNKNFKKSVKCCDHPENTSFSVQYSTNSKLDFEALCPDTLCLQSYNSKVIHFIATPCAGAYGSLFPSPDLLGYVSVSFLVSKFPIPKAFQQYAWIGKWNGFCLIVPISRHIANLFILPDLSWMSLRTPIKDRSLTDTGVDSEQDCDQEINTFVDQLLDEGRFPMANPGFPSLVLTAETYKKGEVLKSNFFEKKRKYSSYHWELLRSCFEKDTLEVPMEQSNHCIEQFRVQPQAQSECPVSSNDVNIIKKLGNNRSHNLRASTLLLKSREMRAKNDEIEREKSSRERKVLLEKKEKFVKEHQTYMQSLRESIIPTNELIKLTPCAATYKQEIILEKCTALKSEGMSSQLDDAQLQSLSQVIVSTLLYVRKESTADLEAAYEIITKNFLKKPGYINRSVSKESKVLEFKLQIFFRLELFWITPPMLGDEDEVLQETVPFFQMLSIHSSPQTMASFYQDIVVPNYECMIPHFLIALGEELNQPIPLSLCEQVDIKADGTSPNPSISSKVPSVHSIASLQEIPESNNPSKEQRAKMLTRHSSFNLQHRKQIALPKKEERNEKNHLPTKRNEQNDVVRVRRSLQFGTDAPPAEPALLTSLETKTDDFMDQAHTFATPSKSNKILAPETPSRLRSGSKSNRKTDGVFVVSESPDVKSENLRRSPRRLEAAMALRRRASFYSTLSSDVNTDKVTSRNWARAESQVWSEKAKATVTMPASFEDNNNANPNHSARFLFSRILSCADSVNNGGAFDSPKKIFVEGDAQNGIPSLTTPRKADRVPSTPSRRNANNMPDSEEIQQVAATPLKTPLKTPKHVQFNLIHQPATPSSKLTPDPRSILKSPFMPSSPSVKKTPKKNGLVSHFQSVSRQLADGLENANAINSAGSSPIEEARKESSSHAQTKDSLSPSSKLNKSVVSPLILRRSPRHRDQISNFYNHNPNWSVVNYRRLTSSRGEKAFKSPDDSSNKQQDPYEFEEPVNTKPTRSGMKDLTAHKRKLFQSSTESPMPKKSRFSSPSKTTSPRGFPFQNPSEGSLFHLENSPIVAAKDKRYKL